MKPKWYIADSKQAIEMNQQIGLEQFEPATDLDLDPCIRHAVLVLRSAGVETFESCQGGEGHAFQDPTIKFHGGAWAGYRAFAVAMEHGLPVLRMQQVHGIANGQLEGPWWELVFRTTNSTLTAENGATARHGSVPLSLFAIC